VICYKDGIDKLNFNYNDMENVDQFYYINLEHRKELKASINRVLGDLGVSSEKITKINAIEKDNGAYGCALSHILALNDAKKNNYNIVVILEDDFKLFNPIDAKEKLTKFFKEVDDWDIINLSCHLKAKEDCEIQNVSKVLDCQSTIAYAVNSRFIDKLLNNFNESASFLSEINYEDDCQYFIDINWKKLQKENKWYTFYPMLGREYPKYSDVQKKYIDHFRYTNIKFDL